MRTFVIGFALTLLLVPALAAAGGYVLYGVGPSKTDLIEIDPWNGSALDGVELWTDDPFLLEGANGLSFDPNDWKLYGVLKGEGDRAIRVLAVIDPSSGYYSVVGELGGENFAAIAFADDGTLYGVTGDGSLTPESLFEIDKGDASIQFIMTLGIGSDGESLAFNPMDGKLYHGSGHDGECSFAPPTGDLGRGDGYDGVCFESIDLTTWETEMIDISETGLLEEEVGALTFWPEQNVFLWTQDHGWPQIWFHVTADGDAEAMGDTGGFQYKGLAFFGREVTATQESSFSGVKSLFR